MCDKEAFARLRDQTEENGRQIAALQKTDAIQSEQLKTLRDTTERQGATMLGLVKWLVAAVVGVLVIVVLALVFGALGERGFNGVMRNAPQMLLP